MTSIPAVSERRPEVVFSDPSSSFACDYVSGVNRVLSLDSYLLIDNIARNIEIWEFGQDAGETPIRRSLYDVSAYPGDPMASLLDVDVHAAFVREGGRMIVVNHYGRARWFDMSPVRRRLQPVLERQLLGDTERVLFAHDCFIASSPRGEHTDDPAQPGVFLFEPTTGSMDAAAESRDTPRRLACEQALADWDVISAIDIPADGRRLAVASGRRIGVFVLTRTAGGLRLGECRWEAQVSYQCQWLHFDAAHRLWAAGHLRRSSDAGGDDWNACRGGGATAFDADGASVFATDLPDHTAWGYGADPLVLSSDLQQLFMLGREGSLYARSTSMPGPQARLYAGIEAPAQHDPPSLGIGHAALRGDWLYAGFSRGGHRLLRYDVRNGGREVDTRRGKEGERVRG